MTIGLLCDSLLKTYHGRDLICRHTHFPRFLVAGSQIDHAPRMDERRREIRRNRRIYIRTFVENFFGFQIDLQNYWRVQQRMNKTFRPQASTTFAFREGDTDEDIPEEDEAERMSDVNFFVCGCPKDVVAGKILIFVKFFDETKNTLEYITHIHADPDKLLVEVLRDGCTDLLDESTSKIVVWEEICPKDSENDKRPFVEMEPKNLCKTINENELTNGDLLVIERDCGASFKTLCSLITPTISHPTVRSKYSKLEAHIRSLYNNPSCSDIIFKVPIRERKSSESDALLQLGKKTPSSPFSSPRHTRPLGSLPYPSTPPRAQAQLFPPSPSSQPLVRSRSHCTSLFSPFTPSHSPSSTPPFPSSPSSLSSSSSSFFPSSSSSSSPSSSSTFSSPLPSSFPPYPSPMASSCPSSSSSRSSSPSPSTSPPPAASSPSRFTSSSSPTSSRPPSPSPSSTPSSSSSPSRSSSSSSSSPSRSSSSSPSSVHFFPPSPSSLTPPLEENEDLILTAAPQKAKEPLKNPEKEKKEKEKEKEKKKKKEIEKETEKEEKRKEKDVIPENEEYRTFHAHKVVLSQYPYFRGLFTSGMKESHLSEMTLSHESAGVFECILKFIYLFASQSDLPSDENFEQLMRNSGAPIAELLESAHLYGIPDLVDLCKRNMVKNLSLTTWFPCLMILYKYMGEQHIQGVLNFVIKNIRSIMTQTEFCKLGLENPQLFHLLGAHLDRALNQDDSPPRKRRRFE